MAAIKLWDAIGWNIKNVKSECEVCEGHSVRLLKFEYTKCVNYRFKRILLNCVKVTSVYRGSILISSSQTWRARPPLTWSVKGIVGIEDCGEEAEGERTDAEGHVKARVSKTLEPLRRCRRTHGNQASERIPHEELHHKRWDSLTPPLLSGSSLCP